MAQATNAMSWANAKIEISTNGSSWTAISGFTNSLQVGGGERAMGEFFTGDADYPIVTSGKRSMIELTVKVVYSEGAGEAFSVVLDAYQNNTNIWLRWSPAGGTTGQFQFTTGKGWVTAPAFPGGSYDSADAVAIEFGVKTLTVTKGVAA